MKIVATAAGAITSVMQIRLATTDDIPALRILIPASVRALQKGYYSQRQMEGAIGSVFSVDTQLILDGTY